MTGRFIGAFLAAACAISFSEAAEFYAAPDGKPEGDGSKEKPWSLAAAVNGSKKEIKPGDTITLREGTYVVPGTADQLKLDVKLAGTADKPITVRGEPGKRATVDGGFSVKDPSASVIIRDLEIASLSRPVTADGFQGGIQIKGGKDTPVKDVKMINLVIHDAGQGISDWLEVRGSEIYGCIIYKCGWPANDRPHGHCIYTQNQDPAPTKTVSNCILSTPLGNGQQVMQAYGTRSYADNYLITENIFYEKGEFTVHSARNPSHNVSVHHNYFANVGARFGWGEHDTMESFNCEFRDNVMFNSALNHAFKNATIKDNLMVKSDAPPKDEAAKAVVLPNKYDANRANLAVFNWKKAETVEAGFAPFLKEGDSFRMMDPKDFYGKPVFEGKAGKDGKAAVPVKGEFGAYVVLKK
jgi:hypothetical protein